MGSTDESFLPLPPHTHTGYEPKDYDLHGDLRRVPHTEIMSVTPSEKACLLVSRRRPCPHERGDPLLKELGDPLESDIPEWLQEFRENFGG